MSTGKTSASDLGAGLNLQKPQVGIHPSGPSQHGSLGQAERAFSAASTFISGILAYVDGRGVYQSQGTNGTSINASQFIGAPLKYVDPKFYNNYMAWTKESFAVLVTTMTQLWSPTTVRITGDESMKDQLYQMPDGTLKCNFPHRLVMMANHQLYTDWLYLWWIAYTNKMHGRIYIILKESLKNVPIFGWAAQFYNFIFIARKWETDKHRFRTHLKELSNPLESMWLLIFPEGTNLSASTRETSKAWAQKNGIPDMKHQLLPRSTGLHFCLQELKGSTNWLYDCTIAYEGVPDGMFGQDIYTLRSSFFEGRPPKSVNMYWRRWRITDLPLDDADAFAVWLRNRWTEKDFLLEHYYRHKSFPEGDPVKAMKAEATLRQFAAMQKKTGSKNTFKPNVKPAKWIETEVKAGGMEEFLGIFAPIASATTAISSGQLSPENLDFDALLAKVLAQQRNGLAAQGASPAVLQALPAPTDIKAKPVDPKLILESPTTGKNLDPDLKGLIDAAYRKTQERISSAAPAPTKKANIKHSLSGTPAQTFATRPISSIAIQRGAGALAKLAPKVGQGRQAAEKKALDVLKTKSGQSGTGRAHTTSDSVSKSADAGLRRRGSTQSWSTTTSSKTKTGDAEKNVPAPLPPARPGTRVVHKPSVKVSHPLAGRTISRAAWDAQQQASAQRKL